MNDKVSIVVPIYNREKFIEKCIKSLIAQTYINIEIILVNDGSKDKSLDICKEYKKQDDRIKIVDKENGGVQSARNAGIDTATGKYLCFVDADDYVTESFISNFIKVYDKEPVECVVCGHIRVDENGKILVENNDMINLDIPTFQSERWALYFERFACYAWNHMFLLEKVREHNVRFDKDIIIFDDTAFTMNYLNHIEKIGYTNSNDYYYVAEHSELTVAKRLKNKRVSDGGCREKVITCINKYKKYVENKEINDKSTGNLRWLSSSLYHIAMISFILYMATVPYDYRYDEKTKSKIFDNFYDYMKDNHLERWHYQYEDLHTKLESIKLLRVSEKIFLHSPKKVFYGYCRILGSSLINDLRIKIRQLHKKW